MRNPGRIAIATIALLAIICILGLGRPRVQQTGGLTQSEERGKLIYLKGEAADGEIKAVLGDSDLEIPATSFPCANCHGLAGEGSKEGGLQPPPIDWTTLTTARTSALTGRARLPYNEASVAKAIMGSVDPSGTRLHPGMPRFEMTAQQAGDVIAYLKKIGTESDLDPGLGHTEVTIGAALPMSGPLSQVGEDIKKTIEASFSEVNAKGGIYDRKFKLVVEDTGSLPEGTLEANKKLIEGDHVFALAGSFEPGDTYSANELLQQREVPLVGPVTISPHLSVPPNPYVFYLMPGFGDQSRVLVDYLSKRVPGAGQTVSVRLAVVYARGDFDKDALAGFKAQAALRSLQIVAEHPYESGKFDASLALGSVTVQKPDYIFFFGASSDILAFARQMDAAKSEAGLLTSLIMLGKELFSLPQAVAAKTFLAYPSTFPGKTDLENFDQALKSSKVELRHPAFQRAAYAASLVLVEGMKKSGSQVTRQALIKSLEDIRDFQTGVAPSLSFGANIRVGSVGSYVVGLDVGSRQIIPLSDWIVPEGY
ncbi:MAG TPA: ABC transporter substrate-binding protein [Blastocatellia bacterium]